MVSPEAEEIPPVVDTEIPPAKVEVAVEEELRPPAATRSPLNAEAWSVEVAVMNPYAGEVEAMRVKVWVSVTDDTEREVQSEEELLKAKD